MRRIVLSTLSIGAAIAAQAQFYPESNAVWCITYYTLPPYDVQMEMGADPDTLILGRTYKRIAEYSNISGQWERMGTWYVRNGLNGQGHVFSLGPMEEYLAGDLGAQPGDTVRDVIGAGDVVVDSISTLTYGGITVVRHYINQHVFTPGRSFWQVGTGTSFGPFVIPQSLSGPQPECIIWNDSVRYNRYQIIGNVYGQPGGEACCSPIGLGIDDHDRRGGWMIVSPNPSSGIFRFLNIPIGQVNIYDSQGRQVLEFPAGTSLIDLTAHPLGVYTAVVNTAMGWQTLRLVVVR